MLKRSMIMAAVLVLATMVPVPAEAMNGQDQQTSSERECTVGPSPNGSRPLRSDVVEHCLRVGNLIRYFLVYEPANLPAGSPAVVLFHGGGGGMRRALSFPPTARWLELAEQHGFLLLVPNGVSLATNDTRSEQQMWNSLRPGRDNRRSRADDVTFVERMVQWAIATHRTDPGRLYATGASNGGEITFRMLIDRPGLFAAGVANISGLPAIEVAPPAAGTPVMMINGTVDPLMPYDGGPVSQVAEPVRSVDASIAFWITVNGLDAAYARTTVLPDIAPDDGCRISRTDYPKEPEGEPVVVLVRVDGGGHWTPHPQAIALPPEIQSRLGNQCRDIDGAAMAWEFMAQH